MKWGVSALDGRGGALLSATARRALLEGCDEAFGTDGTSYSGGGAFQGVMAIFLAAGAFC